MRNTSKRINQTEFEKRFLEKYGDEFVPVSEYKGSCENVKIEHKKCHHIFTKKGGEITSKKVCKKLICPKCNPLAPGIQVIPYINDLSITAPEICEYLVDPEDAHRYRKNSKNKILFKCPVCKKEYYLTIANVCKNGKVPCPTCNDGFSYPNKFMANLLQQLSIDFISEYMPSWIKPYKFDFYIPSRQLIIEMDGAIGHGNEKNDSNKELLQRDLYKDQQANIHNITVIRIDCCYRSNRYEYVKKNILKSKLTIYFDLSKIDWNTCNQKSVNSKINQLAKLIKSNVPPDKIKKILCIKQSCFNYYIRILIQQGTFTQEEIKNYRKIFVSNKKMNILKKPTHVKKVFCYETGEIYESASAAERKFNIHGIGASIHRNGTCGGKHWQYIDLLPSDFNFTNYSIPIKSKKRSTSKKIRQLNLDGEEINTFSSFQEIKKLYGYYPTNLLRVCNGLRKTAYGYKWEYIKNSKNGNMIKEEK